ncbi:DUF935 domain-containing protein [bacterium]|nr:DUF935 domain-containing protein [bacterium]
MRELTDTLLNPAESWWTTLAGTGTRAALDLLETETAGGRYQRSVYELFAEMEEKDGHLYSVLQTRLNGLLGLPRHIQPTGDAQQSVDFVRGVLDRLPRAEEFLRALLDGVAKGFAVVELIWGYDAQRRIVVQDWLAHPQEHFLFDARGRLLLLSPPFRPGRGSEEWLPAAGRTTVVAQGAFPAPPHKFIVLTFGRDARNPYGRGLAQRAYWLYWFKKNNLKFWSIYNEKFGSPTAIATYSPGTPEDERARLLDVVEALQTDCGVVLPESVSLRFLETMGRGDGGTYAAFADWCNDEMSKVVLGATLTSGEGRRSGSMALGSIHDAVRQDYIEADARLLAGVMNETIVRWLVELNFPKGTPAPRWSVDVNPPENLVQQTQIDRELIELGVPLPLSHFYERYGRSHPTDGERAICYDDSNLFQYHLQYGVLTVNEVRARLNLEPVPWGERPTAALAPSGDGAVLSRGRAQTGDPSDGDSERISETEPREL